MLTNETQERPTAQFVVAPNRSLSWRGNKAFWLYMSILSFGIAGVFAVQGFWVVLPFAGVEMVALWLALFFSSARQNRYEIITVEDDIIKVSVGRYGPELSCEFERAWAQVLLDKPKYHGHSSRLLIRSHGREVEIGACLNDDERRQLAAALRRVM